MSTFKVAGVSTQNGVTKVRFANDLASRVKLLAKGGHSPLELIELPKAMSKADACQYLLDTGGVFTQWSDLITETMGKKQGVKAAAAKPAKTAPAKKTPAKTPAKAPAKSPAKAPAKAPAKEPAKGPAKKVTKPAVAEDLEVKEIELLTKEVGEALV